MTGELIIARKEAESRFRVGYRFHSPLYYFLSLASSLFRHWALGRLGLPYCKAPSTCGVAGEGSNGLIGLGPGRCFILRRSPLLSLEPEIMNAFIRLPWISRLRSFKRL